MTHSTVQVWGARQQEIIPSFCSMSPLAPAWQSPVAAAELQDPLLRRSCHLMTTVGGLASSGLRHLLAICKG